MRRFTYAGGGSNKFWSIGRDGATVTVHFGRAGTDGQTQVKELASDAEAEAHVTKLVAQKLKKGYTEDSAVAAAVAEVVAAVVAEAVIEEAPASLVVETAAAVTDEDALVFPDEWQALIHPRRGGRFVPTLAVDPDRAWALVDEFRPRIDEIVRKDHGNVDLSSTAAYLDARRGGPHDAAVVATIVDWALTKEKESPRAGQSAAFVDAWIAGQGYAFTARAVMAQQRMQMNYSALYKRKHNNRYYHELPAPETLVSRLRKHLAVAGDEDRAAAVEALGEWRQSNHELLVTAFLVPERTDWVDAALAADQNASPLLLEALGDLDQLTSRQIHPYNLLYAPSVVPTLVETFGTALAPFLATLYDEHAGTYGEEVRQLLAALAVLPSDEAFDLLLRRGNKRWVRPFVQDAMYRFPVRAARRLASSPANPLAAELLRTHARAHGDLLAKADLPEPVRARLAQLPPPEADADPASLPAVLVDPPWTRKRTATKPATVTGLTPAVTPGVSWRPGERDEWAARRGWAEDWEPNPKQHVNHFLSQFRLGNIGYEEAVFLATGPDELTRQVVADWRPKVTWYVEDWLPRIVARYELDALPGLLHLVGHGAAVPIAEAFLPLATAEVATLMADWLSRLKSVRKVARDWLLRHQETAARTLVPPALGKPGKERKAAEAALRVLDPATVTAVAAEYGEPAARAIADLLTTDPLDVLPARIPKVPAWLHVITLPQLLLRDGAGALPRTAVTHVVTMLAMSKPDDVYAGVDVVKDVCTPDSLAEFAWGLFSAWQSADMPAKDGWALTALGWLGDDETVRRLTPLVRAWPGEGGHARAVNALDVLAAIGTDVALMHLHGIAQKVKFAGLRTKAQEKIAQVAADLELTPDQLADRLVPDLGLDENGSMVLDYGPRKFVVGFDERLVPYVIDDTGARRKDLPKPGVRDDQDKAPAEHKRFAALKKDVRTLAADQVRRLQHAMLAGRRWTGTEFTDLFVSHPLLRHVVRRLVWAHYENDDPVLTFRVAEDSSLAGVTDDTVTLPEDAAVGIPHPLHLGDDLAAWAEIFADYEILQPFPQLGRPLHALTDEERAATQLTMFAGITVPAGKVLGLTSKGWERGEPQDAGIEWWIKRPVPKGGAVYVNLDPGIVVGNVDEFPEQKIESVVLSAAGAYDWSGSGGRPFSDLDAVTASELLAELTELTGTTRD